MKQTLFIMLASLLRAFAGKDIHVIVMTPTPQMHCESCENKIKKNLRFEKGVTKIETSIKEQTVTVTYDAAKTNGRTIQAAMKNIGYDTKVVSDTYMDGGKQKEAKKKK